MQFCSFAQIKIYAYQYFFTCKNRFFGVFYISKSLLSREYHI